LLIDCDRPSVHVSALNRLRAVFLFENQQTIDFIGTRYVLDPAILGARMAQMNRPPRNRSR
jgi:hypothetical protein